MAEAITEIECPACRSTSGHLVACVLVAAKWFYTAYTSVTPGDRGVYKCYTIDNILESLKNGDGRYYIFDPGVRYVPVCPDYSPAASVGVATLEVVVLSRGVSGPQLLELLKRVKTDRQETSVRPTYNRMVVARQEIELAIDAFIDNRSHRSYEQTDDLVFETRIASGKEHPWPKDQLRIAVPKGTTLIESGNGYAVNVPERPERVIEVDTSRGGLAFLIGFYSFLRWVLKTRIPIDKGTDDASIRFSLLELN